MSEIGLGRRVSRDERDLNYLLPRRASRARSRHWYSAGVMDQGGTSQCVAYSGVKYLTTAPVMNRPIDPVPLYRECLALDEWPGEDFDGGTSVRALFKALKKRGYVTEYRWALDAETIVSHVITTGPVVMGTSWHRDMFTPVTTTGYLEITGPIEGGHAWLIIGASRDRRNPDGTRGAVRMINSWGDGWGDRGRAWITLTDLETLVRDDGEACVATEVKI